jgi:hypothetical protein
VPVSGMSDLESYVKNKVINGHCDCMFLVNTYQWEWTTIAALVAPRPLLFANSDNDTIFPMDGNRRIIGRLRKLYKMYDKPELVDEYVSVGGHDYRPDLRVAIFKWINRHIKNETGEVKDSAEFKPLEGKELRVFPEDKDVPADALNGKIDETFVPRAQVRLPEEGNFAEWKKGLLKDLREKSFRTFPERIPAAKLKGGDASLRETVMLLETEPHVSPIELVIEHARPDEGAYHFFVLGPKDDVGMPASTWAKPIHRKGTEYHLRPRGVGQMEWTVKSPPNYVERAHALLGRTVDEGRVLDIVAALRKVDPKQPEKWRFIGRGQAGILAAYAALFEPSIKEVVIVDPPVSHREGPIFLNVLRVLDIPEALGLLAPDVKLTLVNAKDKAFDRTAQIYKLAGAESNFQRK